MYRWDNWSQCISVSSWVIWEACSENVAEVKVQQYQKDKKEQTISSLGLKFKSLGGTTQTQCIRMWNWQSWNNQAGRFDLSSHLRPHLKPNTQVVLNTLKLSEEAQLSFPCSWDFSPAAASTWKVKNCATHLHTQESLYVENLPWSVPLTQHWIRCSFPCLFVGLSVCFLHLKMDNFYLFIYFPSLLRAPTEIPPVLELYILQDFNLISN